MLLPAAAVAVAVDWWWGGEEEEGDPKSGALAQCRGRDGGAPPAVRPCQTGDVAWLSHAASAGPAPNLSLQVARFSSEFMKKKLEAAALAKKKARKARTKGVAAATSTAHTNGAAVKKAAPALPPTTRNSAGTMPGMADGTSSNADWEKVPKAPAAKGKKKGKATKVDASLLGFATGTDYSALEHLEG